MLEIADRFMAPLLPFRRFGGQNVAERPAQVKRPGNGRKICRFSPPGFARKPEQK
jgi:hypothetical protein